MSKKNTGKKNAKAMNLAEFTGDKKAGEVGDTLAWAEDDWEDEQQQEEREMAIKSGLFNRKAGAMDDFRSATIEQLSTVVPVDMVAPFVAHVGNLPNSITEAEFEKAFDEFFPVLAVGVVKRPKSTFGYVEVTSREDLQALILQTGRNLGGRKIRCDVASEQQIDRFKGGGKAEFAFDREALGQQQPDFRMGGGGMGGGGGRGMRQSGSMGDFSRDNFGDQEQQGGGGMGFGGGFGSNDDLGDFRSAAVVSQPPAPGAGGERGARGDGNFRGGNFRGSKDNSRQNSMPASPNEQQPPAPAQDFGGWRDAPVEAQPTAPVEKAEKVEKKEDKAENKERGQQGDKKVWGASKKKDSASPTNKSEPTEGGGAGWRRGEAQQSPTSATAEKKQEVVAKKPNPWGAKTSTTKPAEPAGADNGRFGALRK